MDRLLKNALDNDAVSFIKGFKKEMAGHHTEARETIHREVAANLAGVAVQEKSDPMHVFVYSSGKGIKWRTSDQRTGGEASFSDLKDEKKLRAYFQKVFGSNKEFTLEIREAESTDFQCMECDKKFKKKIGKSGEVKCPGCGSTDVEPA